MKSTHSKQRIHRGFGASGAALNDLNWHWIICCLQYLHVLFSFEELVLCPLLIRGARFMLIIPEHTLFWAEVKSVPVGLCILDRLRIECDWRCILLRFRQRRAAVVGTARVWWRVWRGAQSSDILQIWGASEHNGRIGHLSGCSCHLWMWFSTKNRTDS